MSAAQAAKIAELSAARQAKTVTTATEPAPPEGELRRARRRIHYREERLHEMLASAAEVLVEHPEIYVQGDALAQVLSTSDANNHFGAPAVRRIPMPILRSFITELMEFGNEKKDDESGKKRWVPMGPPLNVVAGLATMGAWAKARPIRGILECPSMRADGTLLEEPGYDRATCYFYAPNADFIPVNPQPTAEDAANALAELRDVYTDFPFVSDAARDVMIALVLTLVARPAIAGSVPIVATTATTRGTGKSLATDASHCIVRGRPAAKVNFPEDAAELEKLLGSYALSSAPFILFDNVNGPFGGGALDRCVTAGGQVELRILGKSEVRTVPWNTVITATGNNMQTVADTARRTLFASMASELERPEDREAFVHPNLLAWCLQNRPRLVAAALCVLRAWHVAGRPSMGVKAWGSFESWSAIVPPAILHAGGANVLAARAEILGGADGDAEALHVILEEWPDVAPGDGSTIAAVLRILYQRHPHAPPDGFDDLRAAIEVFAPAKGGMPSAKSFGNALRKFRGRVIAGKRLMTKDARAGLVKWRVEPVGGVT